MENLIKRVDRWHTEIDLVNTLNVYDFPISLTNKEAIKAGEALAQGIPKEQLRRVGPFLTAVSPESHIGPFSNAIDFLVPDGTEVLAAADGIVVEVVECFNEWGDNPSYRDKLNYVTIKHLAIHGCLEFSQYCHLEKNSVLYSVGSPVEKGRPIAKVGKTGWTDRDHLHFMVFMTGFIKDEKSPFDFMSIPIRFRE